MSLRGGIGVGWAAMVLTLGCGEESVCETAADKMDDCEVASEVEQGNARGLPVVISRDECSGANECLSRCLVPASCSDIKQVVLGSVSDPNEPPPLMGGKLYACFM